MECLWKIFPLEISYHVFRYTCQSRWNNDLWTLVIVLLLDSVSKYWYSGYVSFSLFPVKPGIKKFDITLEPYMMTWNLDEGLNIRNTRIRTNFESSLIIIVIFNFLVSNSFESLLYKLIWLQQILKTLKKTWKIYMFNSWLEIAVRLL